MFLKHGGGDFVVAWFVMYGGKLIMFCEMWIKCRNLPLRLLHNLVICGRTSVLVHETKKLFNVRPYMYHHNNELFISRGWRGERLFLQCKLS